MNHLRQFFAVTFLSLIITLSAFAGEMDTGKSQLPPPGQPVTVTGDMGTPGASVSSDNEGAATDAVVEFALGLMRGAMSLF
jgi:hypothetical protein